MMPPVKRRKPTLAELAIPLSLEPMEALLVAELPKEPGWRWRHPLALSPSIACCASRAKPGAAGASL
jgi:hypothetical protein